MAERYFTISQVGEIEANEFNLNMPRYVDTFRPAPDIDLADAIRDFACVLERKQELRATLTQALASLNRNNT